MKAAINCDLGEGIGNDEAIIPFITAANIACGYHAGDIPTMEQTMAACIAQNVAIGAHISFLDRANFGRIEMQLPVDDLYDMITQQLIIISEVADSFGQKIGHVKPHGALYNMSAKDPVTANVIAKAVRDFDPELVLYGLSGSYSINEGKLKRLETASEVFADRTYQDDGSLTPRTEENALIDDTEIAVAQAVQLFRDQTVTTVSGKTIPVVAETICIHGDGVHAVAFATAIHAALSTLS